MKSIVSRKRHISLVIQQVNRKMNASTFLSGFLSNGSHVNESTQRSQIGWECMINIVVITMQTRYLPPLLEDYTIIQEFIITIRMNQWAKCDEELIW